MDTVFLFDSKALNIGLTIGVSIILVIVYLIQNHVINKHQDNIKKGYLILAYSLLFALFIMAVIGIMMVWDYDFNQQYNSIVDGFKTIFTDKMSAVIASVFTFFVAFLVLKISKIAFLRVGLKTGPLQKRKKTIAKVSQSIIKYLVYIIALLIILALWGVNVIPALAGLGMAGLVVGLGAQKFINDLISGFFIIFEHHFDVGDIIEVGGFKGEVTDIGLKTTKIRNWRGEVKIIANGDVDKVSNFSRNPSIGIVDFGIAYQEDIAKTTELLRAELPKLKEMYPDILEDPQVVGVIELASSSVNMRVIVKTVMEKHYAVERAIRQRIKEILDAAGIEIPFPQVVVNQPRE